MASSDDASVEVLDYISTHAPTLETQYGVSQAELATALGYHRCSMSRPLAAMVTGGLLDARRGPARGGLRRQLVYTLTPAGKLRLRRAVGISQVMSGAAPAPPNPFVGRRSELLELLELSRRGRMVVLVEGPSGMGKTALVSRHVRRIRRTGVPFWFTVRQGSSPRNFSAALAHALATVGGQQRLAYYTQVRKQPVGREVAGLAEQALQNRRLILVVDDAHLADSDMRRFIEEFPVGFRRNREDLFVFISQGPSGLQVPELPTQRIVVGGLDRTAAHALTDRVGGLGDRFEEVFRGTVGSPALLLVAATTGGTASSAASLSQSLVGGLTPDERGELLPVALSSEPVPASLLQGSVRFPPDRVKDLLRVGILQRTSDGRIDLLQVVRAELLKQASAPAEREAHRILAAYYEKGHGAEPLRERFIHLVASDEWRAAVQIVAEEESSLLALGYSDGLRNSLRHMSRTMPAGPLRAKAASLEAQLLYWHSEYSEALAALRRAVGDAGADKRRRAEYLIRAVEVHLRMDEIGLAQQSLTEASSLGVRDRRIRYGLRIAEARIREAGGDQRAAQDAYETIFKSAKKDNLPDIALEGLQHWSYIEAVGPDPANALRLAEDGIPASRRVGRVDITFNLMLVRARCFAVLGRTSESAAAFEGVREEAEELGLLNTVAIAVSGLAAMAIQSGKWVEGNHYGRQALDLAERLGNDFLFAHTMSLLSTGETRQATEMMKPGPEQAALLEEAYRHGVRAIEMLDKMPRSTSLAMTYGYLAETCVVLGRKEEAFGYLQRGDATAEEMGWTLWEKLSSEVRQKVKALDSLPASQ